MTFTASARKSKAKAPTPTVSKWAAAQNGVQAWTSVANTPLNARPDAGTPVVAKVRKSFPVRVWGKYQGWYRVETHDGLFGWIHWRQLSGDNLPAVSEMTETKMRTASERTDGQVMFGTLDQLRTYYAKFKAEGARKGLALQGVKVANGEFIARDGSSKTVASFASLPFVAPQAPRPAVAARPLARPAASTAAKLPPSMPRQNAKLTWREKQAQQRLASRSKQRQNLANKNGLKPKTVTPPAQLKGGAVAPISPEELMRARERYLQQQSKVEAKTLGGQAQAQLQSSNWVEEATSWNALWQDVSKTGDLRYVQTTYQQAVEESEGLQVEVVANAQVKPSRGGSPRDRAQANLSKGIVNQALSYRGMPYRFGAANPKRGFDCSGLIYFMLRQRGYNPPRTAAGFAKYGTAVSRKNLKPGDLVLFANTYKRGVSHIGIYTGNHNFVHAASTKSGVRVDSLGSAYWNKKYHSARRVQPK